MELAKRRGREAFVASEEPAITQARPSVEKTAAQNVLVNETKDGAAGQRVGQLLE